MNYKIKSAITLSILVVFMLGTAIFINNLEGTITGVVIAPICECNEDTDCNDENPVTNDVCLYADNCEAALCVNN